MTTNKIVKLKEERIFTCPKCYARFYNWQDASKHGNKKKHYGNYVIDNNYYLVNRNNVKGQTVKGANHTGPFKSNKKGEKE